MDQIIAVLSTVRKDLLQFLCNKSFVITFFVMIVFEPLLIQVITFQVKEIKVSVVDYDQSELTNSLIRNILYSNDFVLTGQCATYDEALSLVKEDETDCIIEIPKNFEKDFLYQSLNNTSIQPHIQTSMNAVNTAKAIEASENITGILPHIQVSMNAINTTKAIAASENITGIIATSLNSYVCARGIIPNNGNAFISTQNLYNPSSDYRLLMLAIIFINISFIFNIASRLMTNELQFGTLCQISVSPMKGFSFMASKLITCYILSMANILATMAVTWLIYGFLPSGSFFTILLCLSLYVLSCSGIALWACNLLTSTSQMVMFSGAFGCVAMLISGFITPLECVAEWLQPVSYLMPTRYTIIILRCVALKGASISELASQFIPLSIMTVVLVIGALFSFRKSRG